MVEFMTAYQGGMDRPTQTEEEIMLEREPNIEEPIIPISEIGTTAIDGGGQGNMILQNLDKSIRMGTKKIQLVISGHPQGISQLASSHGKDVRREVREKAKSTGVEITGVELSPQRVSGLAGWNAQQGTIQEEQRQDSIRQVKYAVKFAADVAGGGGVDVWSNEFNRNIFDAEWNKGGPGPEGRLFFDNSQEELSNLDKAQLTKYLINERTGELVRGSVVRTDGITYVIDFQTAKDRGVVGKYDKTLNRNLREDDYVDIEGNYVDRYDPYQVGKLIPNFEDNGKQFKVRELHWTQVKEETEKYNSLHKDKLRPEEMAYRLNLLTQIANYRGLASYYDFIGVGSQIEQGEHLAKEKEMIKKLSGDMTDEEKKQWVEHEVDKLVELSRRGGRGTSLTDARKTELLNMTPNEFMDFRIKDWEDQLAGNQQLIASYRQQEKQLLREWKEVTTVENYAKKKVFDSYANAGKYAWQVTREQSLEKPVYVGPEIGWAGQSYGGHPDEFIEIVKSSRKQLAEKLEKEEGMAKEAAEATAKKHIKGMMDTSHLTMWYKHFVRKPGETDEQHIKRFNGWAQDQARKMVREGVVGGMQIVDSITGEHSHLPAGQGIFDIVGMVKAMKEEGFDGPMVSEGHEEDTINQGRILTETWRAFGSPIRSVAPGAQGHVNTWRGIQHSYFGYQMPHTYIVGAYSPSNDWQLWSETPFE